MFSLQIWNYLGLGRTRKRSFLDLGGLKIIITKFFTVYTYTEYWYNILALFGAGKLKFAIKLLEMQAQTFLVSPCLNGPCQKLIFVIVFSTNDII